MPSTSAVSFRDIMIASQRIASRVRHTPLTRSDALSEQAGQPVHLKLEHRQTTGSFKLRGATNAVLSLTAKEKGRGFVAASTGNHGRALAYAARAEGAAATICMSRLVPKNKVEEIRRLGARVHIVGNSQDDAQREVDRLIREEGLVAVPPFDDARVIAGQGSLGLEIFADCPEVATVLVPLSGGGLASGVAVALKAINPAIRVIGMTMERGAAMKASLDAGTPVAVIEEESFADSLGGGIGLENCFTFAMCRDLVDDVVLLSEGEIAAGMRHAYSVEREVIEGAGAVGIAALLAGKVASCGPVVAILSGRNVDMEVHRRVVNGATALAGKDLA
ncbi:MULTISPECIES: hydroxyectoine utilization dehydratase EutB [Rhizobium]|uniref:Threonine dehydratase n=1 Tax=Rhizobium favelukesii TaxID=348824 RepID=W6RNL8_9HYPH|nr:MULTISPECIES: hydroxyectoine utilization dehydratase EutB [Rhizobium]MCS0462345.1 hydroxyectoine utilization dehydratase EutB [Rhizobium favelukesii]UFS79179.1 hydroxyectoine utilization dehydratase EutB [Rhizobium sp. T136]CDM62692.1 putative threonine dehydratase [Rhizobium favelukesii]